MKKETVFSALGLIGLWACAAIAVGHDLIIPYPWQVFQIMLEQLFTAGFFSLILNTAARMLKGLLFSMFSALLMILIENRFPRFRLLFAPLDVIIRTVPTITYIILALIWLGQEASVTAVIFFVLFPTFYSSLSLAFKQFHEKTDELLSIYPVTESEKSLKLALPMMAPALFNALKLAFGMGFKVSVMAEIMNEAKGGIGRQLNICRRNLDTPGIFAWTVWVILICVLMNLIFDWLIQKTKHE